jgi:zinc transport system substrate-binding protein
VPLPRSPIGPLSALALASLALQLGCEPARGPDARPAPDRPLVVVSVAPHRYFVEQLAAGSEATGPAVDVFVLLPPGASPTSFEPGIDALQAIERASLLVRVGHPHFPFERAWLVPLLADRPDLAVVDAHKIDAEGDRADPHEWLSPAAAHHLVDALAPPIAQLTGDASGVAARADALHAAIAALDREIEATLAPVRGGRFLVLHPAWGHFAHRYGLEQLAIEREGKDPGPHELALLVEDAARAGLRDVIITPQVDPSPARSVARSLGGRVVELDPLAADWPDGMRRTAQVLAREAVLP